jgi:hypothetical protein
VVEGDGQVCRSTEDGVGSVGRGVGEQAGGDQAAGEFGEGDLALDAGQGGAEAVVDAAAEGEVVGRVAVPVVVARIALRRSEHEQPCDKFVVVSLPAPMSMAALQKTSSSVSTSSLSEAVIIEMRSSPGWRRRSVMRRSRLRRIAAVARPERALRASPCGVNGVKEPSTIASDQAKNRAWSCRGIPSIMAISRFGSGLARSATTSVLPRAIMSSTSLSATSLMAACHAVMARGVKARETNLRSRVWSGGSVAFIV